jgi:3-phenylpropionate/trans-cinnamate dioxygenase ferredoxin subunit
MDKKEWIEVCNSNDIEVDDAYEFIYNNHIYGIFRIEGGYYAMDGLCTHEQANLIDGYIHDDLVECPKHNARFHITTGKALRRPACIDLKTYPLKIVEGRIIIEI